MESIVKIAIGDFDKRSDGSWVTLKNTDIITQDGGVIRLKPGMIFSPGRRIWGLDIVGALNHISSN